MKGRELQIIVFLSSIIISLAALFVFKVPFLFFFLPLIPFLFRKKRKKEMPATGLRRCRKCGFGTIRPEYTHCPLDGELLVEENHMEPF